MSTNKTIPAFFFILCLAPLSSQAFMMKVGDPLRGPHDCSNRTNTLGSQACDLQGLLHKVALIGKESGRVVSNDPDTLEAQIAEANGSATFCNISVGTLNLIEHRGRKFLVGTAHGFYKRGKLRCSDAFGKIYPDIHYGRNTPGVNYMKNYKFKMPPLNHSTILKKRNKLDSYSDKNLKDLVFLEIKDQGLLRSQLGGERKFIKMANIDPNDLKLPSNKGVFFISQRTNFKKFHKVSYEKGCRINNVYYNGRLMKIKKHNCDTGGNSSGASLSFVGDNNILYSVGIHYSGAAESDSHFNDSESLGGNLFIPSKYVIDALDKTLGLR